MGKQTILFLSANPIEAAQIRADEEARKIQSELERCRLRDRFELVTRWATRTDDLRRLLTELNPAVVHFCGHGGAPTTTPSSQPGSRDVAAPETVAGAADAGLYLVGPDRQPQWVSAEAIAKMFRAATTSVDLVVLNACYSDGLAEALLTHVPCVVGMASSIEDRAAQHFAAGLYGGIGAGVPVARVHELGLGAIDLEGLPDADCPRLRVRAGIDARTFIIGERRIPRGPPPGPYVWQRLSTAIRTAFSDGHGAYLVAMLAFGAAATFLAHTLQSERRYYEALTELLAQEQEAYRGETHQVLSAGLVRSNSWDICGGGDQLLEDTRSIARSFAAGLATALDHPDEVQGSLQKCLPNDQKSPRCPHDTRYLERALTDDDERSSLMVPATVAATVQGEPQRTVLLASRAIADHRILDRKYPQGTIDDEYFVDLSGALRIVPPWTKDYPNRLPAHRTFAGASYMYSTLSSSAPCGDGSPTVTRPYLDVFGKGMVRTLCYRIRPKDQIVGILCFDVSAPDHVVYQSLVEATRVFDLALVKIDDRDKKAEYPVSKDVPKRLSSLSASDVAELAEEWRSSPTTERAAGESAMRVLGNEMYFGASIKHHIEQDKDANWTAVVFGRVRRSPVHDLASTAMTLLFSLIGSAAIVVGVRKKARRLDVALIRGLQVGVMKLDAEDIILGANDRAQEIFDVELPAFDMPKRRLERPLRSLIHDQVVVLDAAGRLRVPVKVKDYDEIKRDRAKGRSSSYYALVQDSNRLIRISGSTYLTPELEVHTFGTFETLIDESHRTKVLAAFERDKRNRRRPGRSTT